MSEYSNLIEAFHKLFFQAMQVFERELDTPIVITSRFEGGESLTVSSISSLYSLSAGTRLRVGHENFMKVHRPFPGWVRWDGILVEHSEVFLAILKEADRGGDFSISR